MSSSKVRIIVTVLLLASFTIPVASAQDVDTGSAAIFLPLISFPDDTTPPPPTPPDFRPVLATAPSQNRLVK